MQALEIVAEEGVAAGTRRITALTGAKAESIWRKRTQRLAEMAQKLGVVLGRCPGGSEAAGAVRSRPEKGRSPAAANRPKSRRRSHNQRAAKPLERAASQSRSARRGSRCSTSPRSTRRRASPAMLAEIDDLKRQLASRAAAGGLSADALLAKAEKVNGTTVVVAEAPSANANLMRQLIDQIRKKASPSAVFLATTEGENKVVLVAGVSRDLVEQGRQRRQLGPRRRARRRRRRRRQTRPGSSRRQAPRKTARSTGQGQGSGPGDAGDVSDERSSMTPDAAKQLLMKARTADERLAAVRAAMAAGVPLSEIESLLDWLDNVQGGQATDDNHKPPGGNKR